MKTQGVFFVLILLINQVFYPSGMDMELVFSPKIVNYQSLFENFGRQACVVCSDRQVVDKDFGSVCFVKNFEKYCDAFEKEFQEYQKNENNRLFFQVTFLDEIIGFMSCQVESESKVIINQLVVDPEKYDVNLIKDFLFAILQLMPKIKEIVILCPLFCVDFVDLFQNLGFVPVQEVSDFDLFVPFELKVHSKCGMCQVLYGNDFWENEDPDAWEQDPDQEDLPIGFYSVDQSRDDVHPLPDGDDGKSAYE